MLLAVDVGNTNITFGVFDGRKLIKMWRCVTHKVPVLIGKDIASKASKTSKVSSIIVSSVVPEIDRALKKALKKKFKVTPLFVTYKNAGIKIGYPRPREIGADRLVDAVAAWKKYGRACIIVDFGTATTLDYIDAKGFYRGGAIAPGIHLSGKALYEAASKLPRITIRPVNKMIPRTTKMAMQAGLYQGYIGMVEHLIKRTIKEVGGKPLIIATGGLAPLIAKGTRLFDKIEPNLTLEGLLLVNIA